MEEGASRTKRLPHLDGLRFFAQMWILASENLYIGWKPTWMKRPDAAVSLFIALSGFCTHWAYADKMSTSTQKALSATFPFWLGRFMKTTFLYYLALVFCIILKYPNYKPPLFLGGFQLYEVPMTTSDYLLAVLPSLTVLHSGWPVQASNKDDVVNGPSWTVTHHPRGTHRQCTLIRIYRYPLAHDTVCIFPPILAVCIKQVMTLIWIWFAYPLAAAVIKRQRDANIAMVVCLVACLLPYTLVQPWNRSHFYGTAFNLLYEWPPFVLPRFLAGVATAELFRRRDASGAPRNRADWWCPFALDLLLVLGWALAAFIPFTGGSDPGFGHRCARSGYEILFDVALIPLWLGAFYLGGLESEHGYCGPLLWLCNTPVMGYLGRWVWGMYIFREPVHIAILLTIPPKIRCDMDTLMDCVGIADDGKAGVLYTRFADMQPWVWGVYVVALGLVSAILTEHIDKYVTGVLMRIAPKLPAPDKRDAGADRMQGARVRLLSAEDGR